jgi:3-oxoacyl-[acyl-carrier-protein] synthase-3
MSFFYTKGIGMAGMAAAVPSKIIDAETLTKKFEKEYIEKFIKSTGISSCHQTYENQTASDLGYVAAEHLLGSKGIDRNQIGILIFVSTSPDYRKPATSCVLQKRLGLKQDCACIDLVHGCAGFMYGHQTMQSLMQTSECSYGLLITAETSSKVIDQNNSNCMMFGDAGAATLYARDENATNITLLKADGNRYKTLIVPSGGFRDMHPEKDYFVTEDGEKYSKYLMYMDGMEIFNFSCNDVLITINEYLNKLNKKADDFDLFACHQANHFILQRLMKKLALPKDKVPVCLDRYGNTSSASIPLVLCDFYGKKQGMTQKILSSGFGVGLAWGVTSFDVMVDDILPVIETDVTYDEGIIS